jgi:hypothetical protein
MYPRGDETRYPGPLRDEPRYKNISILKRGIRTTSKRTKLIGMLADGAMKMLRAVTACRPAGVPRTLLFAFESTVVQSLVDWLSKCEPVFRLGFSGSTGSSTSCMCGSEWVRPPRARRQAPNRNSASSFSSLATLVQLPIQRHHEMSTIPPPYLVYLRKEVGLNQGGYHHGSSRHALP